MGDVVLEDGREVIVHMPSMDMGGKCRPGAAVLMRPNPHPDPNPDPNRDPYPERLPRTPNPNLYPEPLPLFLILALTFTRCSCARRVIRKEY